MALTGSAYGNYAGFFGSAASGAANPFIGSSYQKFGGDQFSAYEKGKDPAGRTNKRFDKLWDDPFNRGSMEILQPIASYDWRNVGPWGPQVPYLKNLFARADELVGRGQSPESIQSQAMRLDLADNLGGMLDYYGAGAGGAFGNAFDTLSFLSDPRLLSPESNPFLAAQGDAITRQTTNNLLQNILPQIRSGAGGVGQFGGSREGVAQGLAVGGTGTSIADALANLYGGAYQQGLGTMLGASGQLGQLASAAPNIGSALATMYGIPANLYSSVGKERETFPWWELEQYKNAVGGKYGEESREVKTDPGYKVGESLINTFMGNFGGLMGGGMMCWVADELYGEGSEKATTLRRFVSKQLGKPTALGRFSFVYYVHGRRWAKVIRINPIRRAKARRLWDELYRMAVKEV